MKRRVLIQRSMNAHCVVVVSKLDDSSAQVCLAEHHHMVEVLPSDRADQSFRKAVLPRRACRDRLVTNAHGAQAARDGSAINGIANLTSAQ